MASEAAPSLDAVAALLTDALGATTGGPDPAGTWITTDQPVRRLGLAVEPGAPPYDWAHGLDALLVHRPFGLWPARLPVGVGVIAYHGALDRWLWSGPAWGLAAALDVPTDAAPLLREGRPIGVVGASAPDLLKRVQNLLGGVDETLGDMARPAERVAVVGAMTDALVRDAAARGATHVVTGQIRRPGVAAADQTGVAILAVGQARAERWALRRLAERVQACWPDVQIIPHLKDTAAPADAEAAGAVEPNRAG